VSVCDEAEPFARSDRIEETALSGGGHRRRTVFGGQREVAGGVERKRGVLVEVALEDAPVFGALDVKTVTLPDLDQDLLRVAETLSWSFHDGVFEAGAAREIEKSGLCGRADSGVAPGRSSWREA
jgi:hypothetical protein